MALDRRLVELLRLTLFDGDGTLGAFAEARPQSVAQVLGHESRLAVDDLDGALSA
jgi:hypothetical protein